MDPIAALQEIVFRLERERSPVFKVQAFRRALDTLDGLTPADLADRARTGRLQSMKGIGGRTIEVIGQALDGRVPDYLAELRDRATAGMTDAGRALLQELRGDLHTHSEWSDGTTPIEEMVQTARRLGREYIALTDHSPRLTIAHGLTAERLTEQLEIVHEIDAGERGIRLLAGIEVDILSDGALDQTPEMLDRLDVVVASAHSELRADSRTMTARFLGAIADPHTSVLGHVTGRLVEGNRGTRPQSTFDAERVFAACAERRVAVEINSRPERQDPPDDLIALALDAGCLFSIDTDAHAPGHLDLLGLGAERAAAAGIPAERIVTTWPVDRLLEWTHRDR